VDWWWRGLWIGVGLVVVRFRVLVVEWRWCGGRMGVGGVAVAVRAVCVCFWPPVLDGVL
jgi:hypothetical protein